MANKINVLDKYAQAVGINLYQNLGFLKAVTNEKGLPGSRTGSIIVRNPASFVANDHVRGTEVAISDFNESSVEVKIDTNSRLDVLIDDVDFTNIFGADLTNEETFNKMYRDYFEGAVGAIGSKIVENFNRTISGAINSVEAKGDEYSLKDVLSMGKHLSDKNVPVFGRSLLLGTQVRVDILGNSIVNAGFSGSTEGLRKGEIGEIDGNDTFTVPGLDSPAYLFHKRGIVMGTMDLVINRTSGLEGYYTLPNGLVVRVKIADMPMLDAKKLSVDVLYGFKVTDERLLVKLTDFVQIP